MPGTITCSRDAVKPAEFYYFTKRARRWPGSGGREGDAGECRLFAGPAPDAFSANSSAVRARTRLSNTVYFRNPGERVVKKYSLATMHLEVGDTAERYAHVVVMPHVGREVLSEFLEDLKEG